MASPSSISRSRQKMTQTAGNSKRKESVLAILQARGGSVGVPRKNVRTVGGHPLVAYSIASALAANSVSRLIVSTDDEEIAKVCRQYGADVPFLRPAEL